MEGKFYEFIPLVLVLLYVFSRFIIAYTLNTLCKANLSFSKII